MTVCRYPVGPSVPGPCGLGVPCPAHGWSGLTADEHDDPPTVVRPSPSWERLDKLMSEGGKVTKDGWNSAAFQQWWTYGNNRETA